MGYHPTVRLRERGSKHGGKARAASTRDRRLRLEALEPRELLAASYVIEVVFDGFRADAVATLGAAQLPNVYRMINEGSWTANARNDSYIPQTLPNHADMLTSRPATGNYGNGVIFNSDPGTTIHDAAGRYVTSVFDIVHDNGLRTGLYASKSKFAFFDRSWDGTNGRLDPIGPDNGRDKIDVYDCQEDTSILAGEFVAAMRTNPYSYAMISFRDPDSVGHDSGWMSTAYCDALKTVDGYLGQILDMVVSSRTLNGQTTVILTGDHGGDGIGHVLPTNPRNYTVPLFAWGTDVMAGGDLYALNPTSRLDPGTGRPGNSATRQPIRNGELANLATQLLGLGVVDGSLFDKGHDLALRASAAVPGPVSPSRSLVAASPSQVGPGGKTTVTLVALDANGIQELTGGLKVKFALQTGSVGGKFGTVTDNRDGTYTATFTAGTKAGNNTITATIDGKGVTSTATVTVLPGPLSLSKSTISASPSRVAVGGAVTVTLIARDANGNEELGGSLSVVFSLGSGSAGGTFGAVSNNGRGTYTVTFTPTAAGNDTFAATIDGRAVTSKRPKVTATSARLAIAHDAAIMSLLADPTGRYDDGLDSRDALPDSLVSQRDWRALWA